MRPFNQLLRNLFSEQEGKKREGRRKKRRREVRKRKGRKRGKKLVRNTKP